MYAIRSYYVDFLSPYIVQKVLHAMEVLQELYEKASQKQETVFYKGIRNNFV